MSDDDRNDIIKKVEKAGSKDKNNDSMDSEDNNDSENNDEEQTDESIIHENDFEMLPKEHKQVFVNAKLGVDEKENKKMGENNSIKENNSIFAKNNYKSIIMSTINEVKASKTIVEPITKPSPTKVKPTRRQKPWIIEPKPNPEPKAIREGKEPYQVYHNSFSSAIQTAKDYVESKGYSLSEDEWFSSVSCGPKKPSEGKTNRYSLELFKNGKLLNKTLNIQVYGMKEKYELNMYIS